MKVITPNGGTAGRKLTSEFIAFQRSRILKKLEIYNDPKSILEQSQDLGGEITPQQNYRLNVVSIGLIEALKLIDSHPEQYGICLDCHKEIDLTRLQIVPGALRCTSCQNRKDR